MSINGIAGWKLPLAGAADGGGHMWTGDLFAEKTLADSCFMRGSQLTHIGTLREEPQMFWEQQGGSWSQRQEEKGTESSSGTLQASSVAVWFR